MKKQKTTIMLFVICSMFIPVLGNSICADLFDEYCECVDEGGCDQDDYDAIIEDMRDNDCIDY